MIGDLELSRPRIYINCSESLTVMVLPGVSGDSLNNNISFRAVSKMHYFMYSDITLAMSIHGYIPFGHPLLWGQPVMITYIPLAITVSWNASEAGSLPHQLR